MRTTFRSRCLAGNSRVVRRRVSVEAVQDAYDPCVRIQIKQEGADGPVVTLPPEVARAYANAILRAVDYSLEGH